MITKSLPHFLTDPGSCPSDEGQRAGQRDQNSNFDQSHTLWDRDHLVAPKQLKHLNLCGFSASRAAKLRVSGDGPPYYKIGSRVFYRWGDILDWLEAQKRTSTSEESVRPSLGSAPVIPAVKTEAP